MAAAPAVMHPLLIPFLEPPVCLIGPAKLLSGGFIGSIDSHAERGSASGSKSPQQRVDPEVEMPQGLHNNVCLYVRSDEPL